MATLLLRLAGPLQSWGSDSRFENRLTEHEPTKSGLVGMISSALGRRRDEPVQDLATLHYGVRTDQAGTVIEDFHTARSEKSSYITRRYYLSDAVFLAGIESDDREFLEKIAYALNHPEYPLYLGRRSCPPDPKLVLGITDLDLVQALETYPLQGKSVQGTKPVFFILEGADGRACKRMLDEPVSFNPKKREFRSRLVSKWPAHPVQKEHEPDQVTEHDPFAELEVSV